MPNNPLTDALRRMVDFAYGVSDELVLGADQTMSNRRLRLTVSPGVHRVQLVAFAGSPNRRLRLPERAEERHLRQADADVLRVALRELLSAVAHEQPYQRRFTHDVSVYLDPTGARQVWRSFGDSLVDHILYDAIQLIEATGIDTVRACPACDRVFVKITRKEYCSTRCQSRIYMRDYMPKYRKDKGGRRGKATRKR